MEAKRKYTIMPFPQGFDGSVLKMNIVVIPRNMDPFAEIETGLAVPLNKAVSFADFQPRFEAAIVKGLDEFPVGNATAALRKPVKVPVTVTAASNKGALLTAIAEDFKGRITLTATDKANAAISTSNIGNSVKKYLPESYRNSFNFTSPRHENARTDDSYHCAMRSDKKPVITTPKMDVSWGELYAHILRQPLLSKACGMVYQTEITVDKEWFKKGGYLFINVLNADYNNIQVNSLEDVDGPFIKRYAARIPKLKMGETRSVFAPILFPVLHRKAGVGTDPEPQDAPWDQIFPEVNEYNDGFAKIVHANQPVSNNLLQEQQDGLHPQRDAGIRMGWDDEQILIWYIRQLGENPNEPGTLKRVDAPLGVFGYCVDIREDDEADWESLNLVRCTQQYILNDVNVGNEEGQELELPFQVYPTQPDGTPGSAYWLPMYYANWLGKSIVMKDSEAAAIYQNDDATISQTDKTPRKVSVSQLFEEVPVASKLIYGKTYLFRVRLMDISGGAPSVKLSDEDINAGPAPNATVHFRRYVAPGILRIAKPVEYDKNIIEYFNETPGTGEFDDTPTIDIKRPLLGYPAVVYTNKYQNTGLDPIQLLKDASAAFKGKSAFGIADPDVTKIEVRVEVEMLKMDNLKSRTGKENYATLYKTTRSFSAGFDDTKSIPVKFVDAPVLNLDDTTDAFNNPAYKKAALDAMEDIILPTARRVRVTVRAFCDGDETYFGFTSDHEEKNHLDTRYGSPSQLLFYKESKDESDLLAPKENVPPLQALYLQPDPPLVNDGNPATFLLQREINNVQPDIVQRLASQFGVESKGLTLVSKKGERVVFGCSNRIKHTLAPDHSSITFASKADLTNHWIAVLTHKLDRDWTWNSLEDVSFKISRYKRFLNDKETDAEDLNYSSVKNEYSYAGDIEIKHTISLEALQPDNFNIINRDHTTVIFIDAIEPKTGLKNDSGDLKFPDELIVEYGITPVFKKGHGSEANAAMLKPGELQLPTTLDPVQVPKLASAGFAFSPYLKGDKYESTEARRKYLWLEFTEPVKDPNDTIFCRMLAYSPDQLISNNHPELLLAPAESALSIDPEFTRRITPGQSDDMAGISAMQPMEKATDSDVHYLLPLPPGMHAESPELFGFFTYEFRIGHGHWSDRNDNLWSTAQGRFGRPLRVTGIQHPAPNLLSTVNRDEKILYVNAPYAQAVVNGKNVTSKPPRTQLWCLLYTQVKQADGKEYRNILLDEKVMEIGGRKLFTADTAAWQKKSLFYWEARTDKKIVDPTTDLLTKFDESTLAAGAVKAIEKDHPPFGLAVWENEEINTILELLGLPTDGPLSVLVVEVFGNITNFWEHLTDLENDVLRANIQSNLKAQGFTDDHLSNFNQQTARAANIQRMRVSYEGSSLSNNLGNFRILRTSPLTEVPFVCCTDCV